MRAVVIGAGGVAALRPGAAHDLDSIAGGAAATLIQGRRSRAKGVHAGDDMAKGVVSLVRGGKRTALARAITAAVGGDGGGPARRGRGIGIAFVVAAVLALPDASAAIVDFAVADGIDGMRNPVVMRSSAYFDCTLYVRRLRCLT